MASITYGIAVWNMFSLHSTVQTLGIRMKHISLAGADGVGDTVLWQLFFADYWREQADGREIAGQHIRRISCHARTVGKAGDIALVGNAVRRIHHGNECYKCMLYIITMAQTRIIHHAIPQCMMTWTIFFHAEVDIRHDKYHGWAFALRYEILQDMYSLAALRPRALIAVDAMQQVQHWKTILCTLSFSIFRRQIDIDASV